MLRWDEAKSAKLKRERGVSFEEAVLGEYLYFVLHPKRPGQRLLLFRLDGYVWVIPCVVRGGEWFLKTLFPSRKYTKMVEKGELP